MMLNHFEFKVSLIDINIFSDSRGNKTYIDVDEYDSLKICLRNPFFKRNLARLTPSFPKKEIYYKLTVGGSSKESADIIVNTL